MPLDVAVLIVNYNAGPHLGECLASIDAGLDGAEWRVVVVDNGSVDGSAGAAARAGTRVRLLSPGRNLGFGGGVNLAAAHTSSTRLLLLNPDCRLDPGILASLEAELASHPECAVVAPGLVNSDGSPQGNARGDPNMLTGLFGRTTWLSRVLPRSWLTRRNVVFPADVPGAERGCDVDWVSGACMFVRREAFDAVGGFDERYFLYWEDADLCRRLRNAGWTIRFRPDARVVHVTGASSRTAKSLAIREFHRSAYRYYATHVAPSPASPRRWAAAALLAGRCAVRLAQAGLQRGAP